MSKPAPKASPAAEAAKGAESAAPPGAEPTPAPAFLPEPLQRAWNWADAQPQNKKAKVSFFGAAVCFGLFFAVTVVHVATATRTATTPKGVVVVFTDGQVDDLLALTFLLRRSDVAVPLVVVSGVGDAHLAAAATTVRRFLCTIRREGAAGTFPAVAVGGTRTTTFPTRQGNRCDVRQEALDNRDEWQWQADTQWGAAALLGPATDPRCHARGTMGVNASGVSALGRLPYFDAALRSVLARAAPSSVVLLSLGPLTDIADYFAANEADAAKVGQLVIAGGAVQTGDVSAAKAARASPAAESNFFADPSAANAAVSGRFGFANVAVMPWDAVRKAGYSRDPAIWHRLMPPADHDGSRHSATATEWLGLALRARLGTTPTTTFEDVARPMDLAAALTVISPRFRRHASATEAFLGVSTAGDINGISAHGVLGQRSNGTRRAHIVTTVDADLLWLEYFTTLRVHWPNT